VVTEYEARSAVDRVVVEKRLVGFVILDMETYVALVGHLEQAVARMIDVGDSPYANLEKAASTDQSLSKHRTVLAARGMCCVSCERHLLRCYTADQALCALGVVRM
jgi:hypothetical protein